MWHFREASYEDTIAESKLSEFFSGKPSEAIVRESFQNSLDAINDQSAPVRIVLTLGTADSTLFPEAYGALSEHWKAAGHETAASGPSRYLLIEDFNTKGFSARSIKRQSLTTAFTVSGGRKVVQTSAREVAEATALARARFRALPIPTLFWH